MLGADSERADKSNYCLAVCFCFQEGNWTIGKTKALKRSKGIEKEATKALAFPEGNWEISKENEVTKELFTMIKGEINFVETIQWKIHPTEN